MTYLPQSTSIVSAAAASAFSATAAVAESSSSSSSPTAAAAAAAMAAGSTAAASAFAYRGTGGGRALRLGICGSSSPSGRGRWIAAFDNGGGGGDDDKDGERFVPPLTETMTTMTPNMSLSSSSLPLTTTSTSMSSSTMMMMMPNPQSQLLFRQRRKKGSISSGNNNNNNNNNSNGVGKGVGVVGGGVGAGGVVTLSPSSSFQNRRLHLAGMAQEGAMRRRRQQSQDVSTARQDDAVVASSVVGNEQNDDDNDKLRNGQHDNGGIDGDGGDGDDDDHDDDYKDKDDLRRSRQTQRDAPERSFARGSGTGTGTGTGTGIGTGAGMVGNGIDNPTTTTSSASPRAVPNSSFSTVPSHGNDLDTNNASPTPNNNNNHHHHDDAAKAAAAAIESAVSPSRTMWFANMSAESIALLNLVAIIWGTQHAVIKGVVDDCDASAFSFARFGLAALLAARYTPPLKPVWDNIMTMMTARVVAGAAGENGRSKNKKMKDDEKEEGMDNVSHVDGDDVEVGSIMSRVGSARQYPNVTKVNPDNAIAYANADTPADVDAIAAWRWGAEMGTWMFLGYAFQAIGLAFTTAQRSGFLLYLNVKFVPFFARIIFGKQISAATWASALAALAGTALLSYDGSDLSLNVGDLWSVAAAAASAMFILRLEYASKSVRDSSALNAASLWIVAFASFVWTMVEKGILSSTPLPSSLSLSSFYPDLVVAMTMTTSLVCDELYKTITLHPISLIYLGGVTTALANYIQTKAQKDISAERASIIYAMDPVYGAFFASLLLGESLNGYGIAGAALITLAAATNAFLDLGQGKDESVEKKKEKE